MNIIIKKYKKIINNHPLINKSIDPLRKTIKPCYLLLKNNLKKSEFKKERNRKKKLITYWYKQEHNNDKKVGDKITILDTYLDSDNSGDKIIMDACNSILNKVFPKQQKIHVSTHKYYNECENQAENIKILCGTNLIYSKMEDQLQWAWPNNLSSFKNTILLGIGGQDLNINKKPSKYTKKFGKYILSNRYYHSVRDQFTYERLINMGINNVINTSCPTLGNFTPEKQKNISKNKSNIVVTSVTDYAVDLEYDKYLIDTLKKEYKEVYIGLQGDYDVENCLSKIVDLDKFKIIGPNVNELDALLKNEQFDYIGTRLHGGIRCLNNEHRTFIITVDNRARNIAKDINLPVIERCDLKNNLSKLINTPYTCNINMPYEAIEKWKKQFN